LNLLNYADFDTSTWLKVYFLEEGSEQARVLATEYSLVSSVILLTECFSALSRKKKSGEIKAPAFKKIIKTLGEDADALEMVQVTARVLTISQHIVLNNGIKGEYGHARKTTFYPGRMGRRGTSLGGYQR
jgi:predicted nucleic acid-binding protein